MKEKDSKEALRKQAEEIRDNVFIPCSYVKCGECCMRIPLSHPEIEGSHCFLSVMNRRALKVLEELEASNI